MWECESCSQPGAYRSVEEGTHRYSCRIEGVKQLGNRLLVTYTTDRYGQPDLDVASGEAPAGPAGPVVPAGLITSS